MSEKDKKDNNSNIFV